MFIWKSYLHKNCILISSFQNGKAINQPFKRREIKKKKKRVR